MSQGQTADDIWREARRYEERIWLGRTAVLREECDHWRARYMELLESIAPLRALEPRPPIIMTMPEGLAKEPNERSDSLHSYLEQTLGQRRAMDVDKALREALDGVLGRKDWKPEDLYERLHRAWHGGSEVYYLDSIALIRITPISTPSIPGHVSTHYQIERM